MNLFFIVKQFSPLVGEARKLELDAMESNQTWSIVPLPQGKHYIGCKWVYKIKYHSNGSIDCYKARLVANGYTQQEGG